MKYTKFGRTGLTVSRLCLGTGTFGTQADEAVAYQILDKAADAGVNFIDTADIYPMGPDRSVVGRAEQIIGQWLRGKPDQFIIATKAGAPMGLAPWQQGGSRKHLLDAIDESLRPSTSPKRGPLPRTRQGVPRKLCSPTSCGDDGMSRWSSHCRRGLATRPLKPAANHHQRTRKAQASEITQDNETCPARNCDVRGNHRPPGNRTCQQHVSIS